MHPRAITCVLFLAAFLAPVANADFTPDPASVQRDGPAYRYPQAGWIVLHVEGAPYERGRQQGKLLWHEIQNYVKCYATQQSTTAPAEAWPLVRTIADSLFLRRFDPELLEEMKGIADGAADAGAKFDGRPLDLTDIVAINVWPEIMTLDYGLHAEPNGLEGTDFEKLAAKADATTRISRCSAFAATGPATKDGKAVIGHITMFDLYPCDFFNVWIDVKPAKGHRLVFQGAPGSVQSGMDWYINDAGLVLTETTIETTRFNPNGLSLGSRSRLAMQYGDSIESAVKILGGSNNGNGLYTNEWLLADMKTNEIALFELGTQASRLMRSSKNEWFGGTTGFYWGNNNAKDLNVRLETIASTNDRPADMIFRPEPRDEAWIRLYQQNKGKIDADFGKLAFSAPPLDTRYSCDAKVTTAAMASQLESFAHWGDPYGKLWDASHDILTKFPDAVPIVPNDWTTITTAAPPPADPAAASAVDLNPAGDEDADVDKDKGTPPPPIVWHGTILPATDGDIWLTSSFAWFHDYVSREKQMLKGHDSDKSAGPATDDILTQDERDELAVTLFHNRAMALSEGMTLHSVPLSAIKSDPSDDKWYRTASGRGVMLLSELRRRLGSENFNAAMEAFGRAHAGQTVDTQSFITAMNAASGTNLNDFFSRWLDSTNALPSLELSPVTTEQKDTKFTVSGRVLSHGGCTPASIDVTIETADDETTTTVPFVSDTADFHITSDKKPTRIVVDKYGTTPCLNGWIWPGHAFMRDLPHTTIVYGSRVEGVANRIAAEKLQEAIVEQWEHLVVPIKADTEITDDDLRGHHILLIGRPDCSDLIERLSPSLPVTFGPRSFIARGQTYANAESAVIAAAANPMDGRFEIVCIAGLSPSATVRAARSLSAHWPAPLTVFPANESPKNLVPPAPDLARDPK
jgi:hypothetical protein